MENKPKEPPYIAVKFANIVFTLGIIYFVLIVGYVIYKIFNLAEPRYLTFYIISILSGCVFLALFSLTLKKLNNNLKVNLAMLFFTLTFTVYGFSIYLEYRSSEREVIAKKIGVSYDKRTTIEVLEDLRNSGVDASPNILPFFFIKSNGLTAKEGRIYPLGTISNSKTILENEAGYYPIIETDEHGFNNPKGLYKKNNVDIVLTGDSWTEGYSVPSNESIGGVLRQSDFKAISVGKAGNSSLIELAALKEYAEPLKPKIVLWLYYSNDLVDLNNEMQSSLLKKYLNEDNYSQNLISRQKEINAVLTNYMKHKWKKEKELEKKNNRQGIINILKLSKIREMINLVSTPILQPPSPPKLIFRSILQKSNQMVTGWGGKMYFVYLTDFIRYSTGNESLNRNFVMQTVTELDIPIIDIHKEVFDLHPDPLSLFAFRVNSHYSTEGYRKVVEAIKKILEQDNYIPLKFQK
tara:strand:+ start:178 stop:1572 length:1395 start_codon:yes stop_codon:yes gene_type:complete